MEKILKGKAYVYKKPHINTDEIIPARYLNMKTDRELGEHALEDLDKDFVKKVKEGDFIVASDDFGCGSSREEAVYALRGAGIRAVIANSFARIFFRNCINNGFFIIECNGVSEKVSNGDELEILFEKGKIKNITKNEEYSFMSLPEFALEIIEAGGLLNYIKKKG